jgi:acetolactate synthase-1/2/3 large subunit
MNGNPEAAILERCDLILAVGLDASDIFNAPWRYTARVLGIEPDATNTQHFLPVREQVVGDVPALLEALCRRARASAWEAQDVAAYRAHLAQLFSPTPTPEAASLTIPAALAEARAILPPETIVTVDAGFGKPLASYLWSACEPKTYFTSHGLSTMGYAIPAANAVQLVHPQRPVLGLMGDGSLLMRASEIGVAAGRRASASAVLREDRRRVRRRRLGCPDARRLPRSARSRARLEAAGAHRRASRPVGARVLVRPAARLRSGRGRAAGPRRE